MSSPGPDRKKVHRFFTEYAADGGRARVTDAEVVHQVSRVLKLRPGEIIELRGGGGGVLARLVAAGAGRLEAEIIERLPAAGEPGRGTLYCAILKKDNFELAAQKATELGVAAIVPVISRRTVKLEIKRDRLLKIIREAAEHSGRGGLPALSEPMTLAAAIRAAAVQNAVFFDVSGQPFDPAGPGPEAAFIGPEGGWEPEEIAAAGAAGLRIAALGGLTRRAETAAVVAAYLLGR